MSSWTMQISEVYVKECHFQADILGLKIAISFDMRSLTNVQHRHMRSIICKRSTTSPQL